MTWLGINPNALSPETLAVCAEILGTHFDEPSTLRPDQLADAFNIVDPEKCRLTTSDTDRPLLPSEEPSFEEWEDPEHRNGVSNY